jgi:hypothetical protein
VCGTGAVEWGRSGVGFPCLLPVVREELFETVGRMRYDPKEHVVEILPGIDAAGLAGARGHTDCCTSRAWTSRPIFSVGDLLRKGQGGQGTH